jgi:hypothetical protein
MSEIFKLRYKGPAILDNGKVLLENNKVYHAKAAGPDIVQVFTQGITLQSRKEQFENPNVRTAKMVLLVILSLLTAYVIYKYIKK